MIEDNNFKELSILYSENAKVTSTFWKSRHMVMTRFFTAVIAMAVMASWFYEHSELRRWTFAPFILAAFFSVLTDMMDRVNTKILRECYRVGMTIEQRFSSDVGIFKSIENTHRPRLSYHNVLRFMYPSSAAIFLIAAYFAFSNYFWLNG